MSAAIILAGRPGPLRIKLIVIPCDHWEDCGVKHGGRCQIPHRSGIDRPSWGFCMKSCGVRLHRGRRRRPNPKWQTPRPNPTPASRPSAKVQLIDPARYWPDWLKPLLTFRRPNDVGLGDVIYHNPAAKHYNGILAKLEKEFGHHCDDRVSLNRQFPLKHNMTDGDRVARQLATATQQDIGKSREQTRDDQDLAARRIAIENGI